MHGFKIGDGTHGGHEFVNVIERNGLTGAAGLLFGSFKFGKQLFGNAVFNVRYNLLAVFVGREVLLNRCQITSEFVVAVFFNMKNNATDIDAYCLFHGLMADVSGRNVRLRSRVGR